MPKVNTNLPGYDLGEDAPNIKEKLKKIIELQTEYDNHHTSPELDHPEKSVLQKHIADKSVGQAQLADYCVGSIHIKDGNVTLAKLADEVKNEFNNYNSAITTITSNLNDEVDTRQAADEALQGGIDTIRSDIVVMSNRFNGKADRVHKHTIEDITDFPQTMTPTDKSVTVDKLSDDAIDFINTNSGGIFTEKPVYKGEIYPVIANQSFSFDNYHQCDDNDGVFQGYAFDMSADVTVYIGDIKYSASKTDEVIVNTSGTSDEAEYYVWLKKYDNGNTEFVLGNYNEYPLGDGYVMLPCGHIYAKANVDGEWSYYDVGLGYEYVVDGEEHFITSTDLNENLINKADSSHIHKISDVKELTENLNRITVLETKISELEELIEGLATQLYDHINPKVSIDDDVAVEIT